MIETARSNDYLIRATDTSNSFNDCKPEEIQNWLTPLLENTKDQPPEKNQAIADFATSLAKSCNNMCKPYRAILLLSANQFTITEPISPRSIIKSIRANQQNKLDEYLLTQSEPGKEFDINRIFTSIRNNQQITKHKNNVEECILAFNNKTYFPAALGVIAIFDGTLSDISNDQAPKFKARIEKILNTISGSYEHFIKNGRQNDTDFLNKNIALISFSISQCSFFESSPFTYSEPRLINRHWIAHGRSSRCVSKLDCIKLFRLLDALLIINELLETPE